MDYYSTISFERKRVQNTWKIAKATMRRVGNGHWVIGHWINGSQKQLVHLGHGSVSVTKDLETF